jgi:hypothetical protein
MQREKRPFDMNNRGTFTAIAILCLAYGAFFAALYLRIRGKTGAMLFAAYSLILAVWATAVADSGLISARDVVALVQALRSSAPQ